MNILIIDDEVDITEIIDYLLHEFISVKIETTMAHSGNEAIEFLKKSSFDLCICDHNMPNGKGSDVLAYIITNKIPASFVLCSTVIPSEMPESYPLENVFFHIIKPEIHEGIELLNKLLEKNSKTASEAQSIDLEEAYSPLSLNLLEILEQIPSDIYIKISPSKYLKCINENTPFTAEDKLKYQNKSITKLYIKKSSCTDILTKTFSTKLHSIMERKDLSINDKMSETHSYLCGLIKFTGINPELAELTKTNINQSVHLLMKNNTLANFWTTLNLLGEYPGQLYSLHSMLSSVIVKKLHWTSEATMFKLTMAAFIQDLSLDSIDLMKIRDHKHFLELKENLTSRKIKRFLDHPLESKNLLEGFKEIPPDIDKVILEQHEMPDGSGFPRKLNANQMGHLSCLFILSGILAKEILEEKENFQIKTFVEKYEKSGYSKGNFREAFTVIKNF